MQFCSLRGLGELFEAAHDIRFCAQVLAHVDADGVEAEVAPSPKPPIIQARAHQNGPREWPQLIESLL
jgi:hypothetical protein